jgi:hypothetical protein
MASLKEDNFNNYFLGVDPDDPDVGSINWKEKSRFSWKIGAVMSLPLSDNFSFMPQLNLLNKGGKYTFKMDERMFGVVYKIDVNTEMKLTYLELPLNFVYNKENFFIGAGPSISYGLSGEYAYKAEYFISDGSDTEEGSESDDEKVKFDNDDDADHLSLKPLEFGANFLAGYKLANGLFIQANANIGLNNISPYDDTSLKTRYFGIGIGYFFGGGNAKK